MGIPAGLLGSAVFNDYPRPLHIAGTREQYHDLFEQLATAPDAAATNFERYMETRFQLAGHDDALKAVGPRRFRADYRRLLRGWGFDANSREGAVLKAWVENRFGLFPIFHKQALTRVSSPAWGNYVEEKMSAVFTTTSFCNSICSTNSVNGCWHAAVRRAATSCCTAASTTLSSTR